jgi:hypothetical protein
MGNSQWPKGRCWGLDIEMPATSHYGPNLLQAVEDGKVMEEVVDESAFPGCKNGIEI